MDRWIKTEKEEKDGKTKKGNKNFPWLFLWTPYSAKKKFTPVIDFGF